MADDDRLSHELEELRREATFARRWAAQVREEARAIREETRQVVAQAREMVMASSTARAGREAVGSNDTLGRPLMPTLDPVEGRGTGQIGPLAGS